MLTKEAVDQINLANVQRCQQWHDINDWSPMQWANAMAGEMGELCNVLKKILRHDMGIQQAATDDDIVSRLTANTAKESDAIRRLLVGDAAQEIGDTYIYMDLLMTSLGTGINPWLTIDLEFENHSHVSEWGCELARRVGILCGAAECGVIDADDTDDVLLTGDLAGSVLAVLTVIAEILELDIEACIRDDFNRVSEREGLPQRL